MASESVGITTNFEKCGGDVLAWSVEGEMQPVNHERFGESNRVTSLMVFCTLMD